jgi:hypothetical protein
MVGRGEGVGVAEVGIGGADSQAGGELSDAGAEASLDGGELGAVICRSQEIHSKQKQNQMFGTARKVGCGIAA